MFGHISIYVFTGFTAGHNPITQPKSQRVTSAEVVQQLELDDLLSCLCTVHYEQATKVELSRGLRMRKKEGKD